MKRLLCRLRRWLTNPSRWVGPSPPLRLFWVGLGAIIVVALLIAGPRQLVRSAAANDADGARLGVGSSDLAWVPAWAPNDSSVGSSDAPELINYQGELTDNTGNPLANTTKTMTFRIFPQENGGDPLWTESHSVTTDDDGKFNVLLGALTLDLTNALAGDERWLEVQVDAETLSPRQRIGSVAYALHADRAATISRPGFVTTTLDSDGNADLSLAIGADGLPVIGYNSGGDSLNVAHCTDLACTGATITTIDTGSCIADYVSIAIGADDLPVMSYESDLLTGGHLQVAHCSDLACTHALTSALPSGSGIAYTSIAIGTDGLPLIGYVRLGSKDYFLEVAHCDDLTCSTATSTTLDSSDATLSHATIAIGADGLGLISYHDWYGTLEVAHCNDVPCSSATTATIPDTGGPSVGYGASIAIGVDGLGLISYLGRNPRTLRVAHCKDLACSSATVSSLEDFTTEPSATSTFISIGSDGLGLISYQDPDDNALKVAHCTSVACNEATIATVGRPGTGQHSSLAVGADGMAVIGYHGAGLETAHCSNRFCLPYVRP